MIILHEKKSVSDHIRIEAFPAAKKKGELCVFGAIIGFADIDTAANEPGTVSIGKMAAIFTAKREGFTPAICSNVYINAAGDAIVNNPANGVLLGTVVAVGSESYDLVVLS